MLSLVFSIAYAACADTEYSNSQLGIKMKVLNYDTESPTLRIENYGRATLGIRNDITIAAYFFKNGQKALGREGMELRLNGMRDRNIPQIAIIGPGAALEVPLRMIWLHIYEKGAQQDNWDMLKIRMDPGEYSVKFSSNGNGITVLENSGKNFSENLDIPECKLTVKE
jgi:hypothetical protein